MADDEYKKLTELLEKLKKAKSRGVSAENLSSETKKIMEMVETSIKLQGFNYVADNGFGQGTKPPKIPGYDRIPDFAVDRNNDGNWDMIIEVKSSHDWDSSDEQLKDFYNYARGNGLDLLIVVNKNIYPQAEKRYSTLGLFNYAKCQLVQVG